MDEAKARLIKDITAYRPVNEQETVDKEIILATLRDDPTCLTRDAQAHLTCSIWVVDPSLTKTLLVHHNIYDSWSWIGGHADGEADLKGVALKELAEETGVDNAKILDGDASPLFSLEVLTVDGHEKRGRYVSSHLHLNITYLAVADRTEAIRAKEDENSGVMWASLEDVVALSSEPWIRERIYRKLIEKTKRLRSN